MTQTIQHDLGWTLRGQVAGLSQDFAGMDIALRPTLRDGVFSRHLLRFRRGEIGITWKSQ